MIARPSTPASVLPPAAIPGRILRQLSVRGKLTAVTLLTSVVALVIAGGMLQMALVEDYRSDRAADTETLARLISANSTTAVARRDRAAAEETLGALAAKTDG